DRRARAHPRHLARARHRALPAALAARSLSQARFFGQGDDVGLVRLVERDPDAGDEPVRARADHAGTARMAYVGPVLRAARQRWREARVARRAEARAALRR